MFVEFLQGAPASFGNDPDSTSAERAGEKFQPQHQVQARELHVIRTQRLKLRLYGLLVSSRVSWGNSHARSRYTSWQCMAPLGAFPRRRSRPYSVLP